MGMIAARDGTQIYLQDWKPPEVPVATVVLIHGAGEHGGRYPRLVDALVGVGCRVVAADLRGHGRSHGRRGSVKRFVDYLDDLEVVVERAGAPRFLIGYSLGGVIAAEFALRNPEAVAGIVLAAPALGPGKDAPEIMFRVAGWLAAVMPHLPLFRMPADTMSSDPDVLKAYRADPLVHHGWFDARLIAELTPVMRRVPLEIRDLRVPLLVLHGESDTTAAPDRSRLLIQRAGSADATLQTYPGVRHDLFNEPQHDQILSDLTGWLTAHIPTPANK